MNQLRFPNQPHPFAGRAVEEARYDEVPFMRQVRLRRRFRMGRSWAGWFANAAIRKAIIKRRTAT